jgi:hypothetical protein
MTVFWCIVLYSLVEVYWHFRCAYCLHYQGSKHLWNVFKLLPDYIEQQPRRQSPSYLLPWEHKSSSYEDYIVSHYHQNFWTFKCSDFHSDIIISQHTMRMSDEGRRENKMYKQTCTKSIVISFEITTLYMWEDIPIVYLDCSFQLKHW